ncbi:hypothetical protein Mame01_34080 [Microbispora amethystogenes]|nr:hypothetical protein Mame01_34080 [Microbispora amethystogenes]
MEVHGQAIQSHRQFQGTSSGGRRGRSRVLSRDTLRHQGMSFVKPPPAFRAKPLLIQPPRTPRSSRAGRAERQEAPGA